MRFLHDYFSDPKKIRRILRIHAWIFLSVSAGYYVYYLATLHGLVDRDGNPFGRDFTFFWRAAQILKHGEVGGLYSPSTYADSLSALFTIPLACDWRYPPYFLFLLWPFTFFSSYSWAYGCWTLINTLSFALALFWRSHLSGTWRWIVFSAPMVLLNLFVGQAGLLVAALFIGGFRLLANYPGWAGVLLGLISLKPQFALLIPFILLALKQYKAFLTASLTFGGMMLASLITFGWESWQGFFAYNLSRLTQPLPGKMISLYAALQLFEVPASLAFYLQALLAMAVTAALCLRLRPMRKMPWVHLLKLIVPALYLVTPYTFVYDLCLLDAVWIVWLHHQDRQRLGAFDVLLWLALWYAPLFNHALYADRLPLIPILLLLAFITAWNSAKPGIRHLP